MISRITFARFDAILEGLGFRKELVRGSHVNYRHSGLDSPLMIRLHKPNDIVPSYVLLGTRVELDNFGILTAQDFEKRLNDEAA